VAVLLFVGTDDEDDMTTLAGVDLYPMFLSIPRNLRGHPFDQKLGFVIVGVMMPMDWENHIYMAKRIGKIW